MLFGCLLLVVCCCTVLKVSASLLTTPSATHGVRITSNYPTTRARDPSLHRSPSRVLGLYSFWQPMCQYLHAPSREVVEGQPTNQRTSCTEGLVPDLPCYPPLLHGSSRFEVVDRWGLRHQGTQKVRVTLFPHSQSSCVRSVCSGYLKKKKN